MNISINNDNYHNLKEFEKILHKDVSQMINEALEAYFEEEQKKLFEKSSSNENAQTNLDFNEFWDGVEV